VADSKVKTATEASVKQQNANLLQALTDHVLGWGREEKAWLYRVYMSHYFSHKDVKRIRLNKTISSVRDVFKRENILK
jgi:putative IMPACT (imprinted ancient) family translation regulator